MGEGFDANYFLYISNFNLNQIAKLKIKVSNIKSLEKAGNRAYSRHFIVWTVLSNMHFSFNLLPDMLNLYTVLFKPLYFFCLSYYNVFM